ALTRVDGAASRREWHRYTACRRRRGELGTPGGLAEIARELPEPARAGSTLPGLDCARVRESRLGGRSLYAERCRHGRATRLLARDGHRLPQRRAGGCEPSCPEATGPFPDP